MKLVAIVASIAFLFLSGCDQDQDQDQDKGDASAQPVDRHRDLVAKFQASQREFRDTIATVKDAESFDAAKPALDEVVSRWKEIADSLGDLEPPSNSVQVELRAKIDEGHFATEPTSEDMLILVTVEGRGDEISRWLGEFAEAGRAAGTEINRLYGPSNYGTHHSTGEEEPDLGTE